MRPGSGLLELCRQADQGRLICVASRQLHADRQAAPGFILGPVQGQRNRRLAGRVGNQREAGEMAKMGDVLLARLVRVIKIAERRGWLHEGRREPDVMTGEKCGELAARLLQALPRQQVIAPELRQAFLLHPPGRGFEVGFLRCKTSALRPGFDAPAQITGHHLAKGSEQQVALDQRRCFLNIMTQLLA